MAGAYTVWQIDREQIEREREIQKKGREREMLVSSCHTGYFSVLYNEGETE